MNGRPTWIDACHGLGGFRLGFEAAGWECVDAFDIKPRLVELYRSRGWESRVADILALDRLEHCDVLVSGAPCQSFSAANQRRHEHSREHKNGGRRCASIPELLFRLARSSGIPVVLMENVEGLLSADGGRAFYRVLASVAANGFLPQWSVVDCSTLGATTARRRLLLLAVSRRAEGLHRFFERHRVSSTEDGHQARWPYSVTSSSVKNIGWGGQLIMDFDARGKLRRYRSLGRNELEAVQGFPQGWSDPLSKRASHYALADSFPPAAAYTCARELGRVLK